MVAAHTPEIAVLLFRILGTPLGIDARQIARTTRLSDALATGAALYYFHERVACAGRLPDYPAPVILHPASSLGVKGGLIVGQLDDMQRIEPRAIRRLPRCLAQSLRPNPYWGVAWQNDRLILLLDLAKVLPTC